MLIEIGSYAGGFNTLAALFMSTFLGVVLIKSRFRSLLSQFQSGVFDLQMLFLPLAGFLFLFPGFISDILALLLLIPSVQFKVRTYYSQKHETGHRSDGYSGGQTIDGEFTEVDDEERKDRLN